MGTSTNLIKLLIADDQPWVRVGLTNLLSLEDDLEVIAECDSGEAVLNWIATSIKEVKELPDVFLLDIRMPNMGGIEAAETLLAQDPERKVILLTTFEEEEDMIAGLKLGISAYLLKDVSVETLTTCIRRVANGERYIQPRVSEFLAEALRRKPVEQQPFDNLTPREEEVLSLITRGLSNKAIAEALTLTQGTVKIHVSSILSKLGATDRLEAAQLAQTYGLIEL